MVDAALLIASTERPIRFLMFKDNYEHPLIKPFARILGVIPISAQQRPREMIHSLRTATQALKDGEIVCIFPEGQMTRIGQMLPFRRGMERIVKGVDVPIIPVYLGGVWGSVFSFERGRFLWKMPRRIPYPVTVLFGKPHAGDHQLSGSPPRRAGAGRAGRAESETSSAPAAAILRFDGAAPPFPLRNGGREHSQAPFSFGSYAHGIPGPAAAFRVARPANGRHLTSALHSRRTGEFCGVAHGQDSGESQLHRVR